MSRELTEVEADSLHTELKEAVATFFGGSCSHSSSFEVRILKSLNYKVKPIHTTPPRTPRISGLKSQILRPTFLS